MTWEQIWGNINDRPTADQREVLRSQDTQEGTELVLTTPTGAANGGYAYHKIASDGTPICGNTHEDLEPITRRAAKRRNKSPCGMCQRLIEAE